MLSLNGGGWMTISLFALTRLCPFKFIVMVAPDESWRIVYSSAHTDVAHNLACKRTESGGSPSRDELGMARFSTIDENPLYCT